MGQGSASGGLSRPARVSKSGHRFNFISLLLVLLALLLVASPMPAVTDPDCGYPDFTCVETARQGVSLLWALDPHDTQSGQALASRLADQFSFAQLIRALRLGPQYSELVDRGWQQGQRVGAEGTEFPYSFHVPESYSAQTSYPLHIYLHGYTARRKAALLEYGWPESVISEQAISLFPEAWADELWWHESQTQNLRALVRILKQRYNIDENRIYLHGISDGGSGTWQQATVDATTYAAFVPVIGNPNVNSDAVNQLERDYYPLNLLNRPFLVVNTEKDPVYPGEQMNQVMNPMRALGVDLEFVLVPDAGHETGWLDSFVGEIEAFRQASPRQPIPEKLFWRASADGFADRFHWVRIDATKPAAPSANLESANPVVLGTGQHIFPRTTESGRLMAMRENNRIMIASEGVERITLLLSPDMIDFSRPVRVIQNDHLIFAGRVSPSRETMLKWAATDMDRSMLFAAELSLTLDVPAAINRASNRAALGGPPSRANPLLPN